MSERGHEAVRKETLVEALRRSGSRTISLERLAKVLELQHQYYSGLISFMIDWFDLLAVQGTLKSLLQHHSSKTSILRHSAFFQSMYLKTVYRN